MQQPARWLLAGLSTVVLITGCSQLTTSAEEREGMREVADSRGDAYVQCIVQTASGLNGQTAKDAPALVRAAEQPCADTRAAFEAAQTSWLKSQYMLTAKPLDESVAALQARAETELVRAMSAGGATAAAAAGVVPQAAVVDVRAEYFNCLDEQAARYAALDEPATAIADVAQNRCAATGAVSAELQAEGRARVLGNVMDARLAAPPR